MDSLFVARFKIQHGTESVVKDDNPNNSCNSRCMIHPQLTFSWKKKSNRVVFVVLKSTPVISYHCLDAVFISSVLSLIA